MNDQNYIENVKKGLIMDEELIKSKKEKNKLFISSDDNKQNK